MTEQGVFLAPYERYAMKWPIKPPVAKNSKQLARIILWRQRDVFVPRELTFELTRFRRVAGSARLACTQQTDCGMHASIFSHTRTTTRAGSLVYVRVESGRDRAREENMQTYRSFQQFWNGYGRQRVIENDHGQERIQNNWRNKEKWSKKNSKQLALCSNILSFKKLTK